MVSQCLVDMRRRRKRIQGLIKIYILKWWRQQNRAQANNISRTITCMSQKAVYTPIMGVSIVKAHGGAMKKQILIALNKPYGVLSQFTDAQQRPTLGDYVSVPDVYAAGRLDKDSEGLMLLTNDGRLQERITHHRFGLFKTY